MRVLPGKAVLRKIILLGYVRMGCHSTVQVLPLGKPHGANLCSRESDEPELYPFRLAVQLILEDYCASV